MGIVKCIEWDDNDIFKYASLAEMMLREKFKYLDTYIKKEMKSKLI